MWNGNGRKGKESKGRLSTTDAGPSNAFHRRLGSLVQLQVGVFYNKPRLFEAVVSTIKEKQRLGVKPFSKIRTIFLFESFFLTFSGKGIWVFGI